MYWVSLGSCQIKVQNGLQCFCCGRWGKCCRFLCFQEGFQVQAYIILLCFALLHFTDIMFFHKLKARHSTSKEVMTRYVVVLALLQWSRTEPIISELCLCLAHALIPLTRHLLSCYYVLFSSWHLPLPQVFVYLLLSFVFPHWDVSFTRSGPLLTCSLLSSELRIVPSS